MSFDGGDDDLDMARLRLSPELPLTPEPTPPATPSHLPAAPPLLPAHAQAQVPAAPVSPEPEPVHITQIVNGTVVVLPPPGFPQPSPAEAARWVSGVDSGGEVDDTDMDDIGSFVSLTSLTPSMYGSMEEHGRAYHSFHEGKYCWPHDHDHQEFLDIQHRVYTFSLRGQLHFCPDVAGPSRVLELGTGTGVWAMDYADAHPDAEVIGVDLSPIQPRMVPENLHFEMDDLELPWCWGQNFDFIYWRFMHGCFADVDDMVRTCFENLNHDGYLEMFDGLDIACDDGSLPGDCALVQLVALAKEASERRGRPITKAATFAESLVAAGFVNVTRGTTYWPTNSWPADLFHKTVGVGALRMYNRDIEGAFLALITRHGGMDVANARVLLDEARKNLNDINIHACWVYHWAFGQKP